MPQRTDFASEAARAQRAAQSDLASLLRAMKSAQDALSGLRGAIKAPNTTPRRHTIRKTTNPGLFGGIGGAVGSLFARSLSSATRGALSSGLNALLNNSSPASFYQSPSQAAAQNSDNAKFGLRIL